MGGARKFIDYHNQEEDVMKHSRSLIDKHQQDVRLLYIYVRHIGRRECEISDRSSMNTARMHCRWWLEQLHWRYNHI